jgi:GT2 family glycosyltransferase
MAQVMLSVIAVNYNSSSLLHECFSSIGSAIGTADFEFIAVDSGSHETDVAHLLTLQGDGVEILLNKENVGYAKAVNQGLTKARGDFILITNPDVLYGPESLQRMMKSFSELPRCGAVGPLTWWNKQMTFLLPASEIITPCRIAKTELVRGSTSLSAIVMKNWIKRNIRYWQTAIPLEQEMLAGASIMTTKKVLDVVGGFDDAFPLYFEDADWCLRARKSGYALYMDPRATIVHYYNQSAKQDAETSRGKFDYSLGRFSMKHYAMQSALMKRILKFQPCRCGQAKILFDDMGKLTSPPVFRFQSGSRKLLLLSPVDSLMPAAGAFFHADTFGIPEDLWECLGEGRYFVKAFALDVLKGCGAWTWSK